MKSARGAQALGWARERCEGARVLLQGLQPGLHLLLDHRSHGEVPCLWEDAVTATSWWHRVVVTIKAALELELVLDGAAEWNRDPGDGVERPQWMG